MLNQGLRSHPTPTAEQIAQADAMVARAQQQRQSAEASFQRCDTDGFLSQWASTIGADKHDVQVEILRHGGYAEFLVLVDNDGNVVADRRHQFAHPKFEWVGVSKWRLTDEAAAKADRRWIPVGEKSRVQKQLGLKEDTRWFPAAAKITTSPGQKSTGLSGCANAFVRKFRTDMPEDFQW